LSPLRRAVVPRLTLLLAATLAGGALLAPAGQAATFTVNNTTDDAGSCPTPATCSLRQALADADATAGSDAVVLSLPAGSVISLTAGPLVIDPTDVSDAVAVTGPGAAAVTVRRDPAAPPSSVLNVVSGRGATLSGFTISGGLGAAFQGAAINVFTTLDLDRMVITGNTGDAAGAGASGALVVGGSTTIRGSTLHGNSVVNAGSGGSAAAVVNVGGSLVVINSTIADNHVAGAGGGDGGAILNFGSLTLVNATVAGNSAEGGAGGILGGPFDMASSILAGNTGSLGPDCSAALESRGYSLVGSPTGCTIATGTGDQVGTALAPLNPLLGPLAANGGTTPTMALLAGSPAIDAGSPASPSDTAPLLPPAAVPCATTDQRGTSRPAGPRCDVGAFEVAVAPPPPPPVVPPPVAPPPAPFVAPPVDHFKCYDAVQRGFRPRTVRLRVQFASQTRTSRVKAVKFICNPVRRDKVEIAQPKAHLVCYATKDVARFTPRTVVVTNQSGTSRLQVLRPVSLCVPSLKRMGTRAPGTSPDPQKRLDHFRCYAVKPKLTPGLAMLTDQFVKTRSSIVTVVGLCNPVSKNGGALRRPAAHLVCYTIRDVADPKTRPVTIRNQFGVARLRAKKARQLCVPSFKRDQPTASQAAAPRSWTARVSAARRAG
jgi:hypothetical protein